MGIFAFFVIAVVQMALAFVAYEKIKKAYAFFFTLFLGVFGMIISILFAILDEIKKR